MIAHTRSGIRWARGRAWHWQDVAHIPRSATIRGAARTHSVGYLRWVERRWNRRRLTAYRLASRRLPSSYGGSVGTSVPAIICSVFGAGECSTAKSVAWCESRYSTTAVNGQYLGIFQMGSAERARFATIGYATAYEQVVAAHNYFVVAGWGPWACA